MKILKPSADRREHVKAETRTTMINGKSEVLPADPHEIARILKERRAKSPALQAKARMAAERKKRGL
ncbi:MAG: hypothetical protein CTR54_07905 [Rhizobium sp.]|nr:MAG: hypothetical protein CTR54_07905 [Rhizobium sp.]